MNGLIEVMGMIIKVMPVGEWDKRITILTRERGKLSAFARGARRTGNSFMGVTRVFAFGSFKLYEGRDSYNLHSAEIKNYFEYIADDIITTCYASYFLELADYYAREYVREPDILKLLYMSLLALKKKLPTKELVRRIYELRIMAIGGEYDELPLGSVGDTCKYTWNYIIHSPIERLFSFTITDEALCELSKAVGDMVKKYIDRPMNSLRILEDMLEH